VFFELSTENCVAKLLCSFIFLCLSIKLNGNGDGEGEGDGDGDEVGELFRLCALLNRVTTAKSNLLRPVD
jgi:hypothetical protein